MSLFVVERPPDPWLTLSEFGLPIRFPSKVEIVDSCARDGEWHVVVTLPHEIVEWDGMGVPAFEGDVERIEWERRRCSSSTSRSW